MSFLSVFMVAVLVSARVGGTDGSDGSDEPVPEPWFESVADELGVDFVHRSGEKRFWFPEIMGSGVALFDADGDGALDIYAVQSGDLASALADNPPNQLFLRTETGRYRDATESSGAGDRGYGMGVACGDVDADGDVDLYVTNVGPNVFLRNTGDGHFEDSTEDTGTGDARWGTSCAFVDIDGDLDLDLFVVNNLTWSKSIETECVNFNNERDYCSPNNYNARSTDLLYRNDGEDGFVEVSKKNGLHFANGNGLGLACADFDSDGDVDVYVANDANPNVLWRNDGKGQFEDIGLTAGCAVNRYGTAEAGMGVQFNDIDGDGLLDLFMTHLRTESNTFYQNRAGKRFSDRTHLTGTNLTSLPLTGFGMGIHDFDLDGHLDLYVVNGGVQAWNGEDRYDSTNGYAEPNMLFAGRGKMRFVERPNGGERKPSIGVSRGAAFGDLDGDGDVDVVVQERDAPLLVLRNVAPRGGAGWVGVRVVAGEAAVDLVGATVTLEFAEATSGESSSVRATRLIDPAYSYLSSNDPHRFFGIPNGLVPTRATVSPIGRETRSFEVEAGRINVLSYE